MKKRVLASALSILFVLSFSGLVMAQQKAAAGPPSVVNEMVSQTRRSIKIYPQTEVKSMLDKKEKVIYLDVRDPGEFAAGHIPGAMNISRGTLEFNVFNKIQDQSSKIIVYCKTKGRSTLATKTLNDLGYKNAALMDAQFEEWIKAGYPVER